MLHAETTNWRLRAQPTLNQRFAATEREQTGLKVTLFVNVFGVFLRTLAAHNGLVGGSRPAGQRMKLIAYRLFCGPLDRKRLENLGNAFSVHTKISIEKPVREVEDPSSAAVDHRKIFIRRFELSAHDLGSSSNIRQLPTIADPVATRWRFLKSKKPPKGRLFNIMLIYQHLVWLRG